MRKIIAIALIATGVASCKTVEKCEVSNHRLMQMYKLGYIDGAISELKAIGGEYSSTFEQDSAKVYELIKED